MRFARRVAPNRDQNLSIAEHDVRDKHEGPSLEGLFDQLRYGLQPWWRRRKTENDRR